MEKDCGRNPVRRGNDYCSPKCGFGCKLASYDRAAGEADALAQRMGNGWEPIVWENCGWNYMVKKECVTIHVDRRGSGISGDWEINGYSAWIEPKIVIGGTSVQFIEHAETPEDALGFATQSARTHVARLNQALADVINGAT